MRSRLEGTSLTKVTQKEGCKMQDALIPSTGTAIVLTDNHPPLIRLNLTGSTNIQLQAPSANNRGMEFEFINESTGAVVATLTGSTGGALVAAGTFIKIAQNKRASARSNGSDWYTLGASTV